MKRLFKYFVPQLLFIQLFLMQPNASAQSVTLAWSPSESPDISHYVIYRKEHLDSSFKLTNIVVYPDSTYIDENVQLNSKYYYVTTAVNQLGVESNFSNMVDTTLLRTSVDTNQTAVSLPEVFRLEQNYPNPFNPSTAISYSLPKRGHVELTIYDINGQVVDKLVDAFQEAGQYTVKWSGMDQAGNNVPSGTYFYKIKTWNTFEFRKMLLIR